MAHYLLSYDLHNQRSYEPVWSYLTSIGGVRLLESLWVATTTKSAVTIRDELSAKGDHDDSFVVIELKAGSYWAAIRAKTAGVNWLRANIMA